MDYHFYRRFQLFKKHVLFPKFNIVDEWDRYEWQARGSAHNHGVYWCEGVDLSNEVEKKIIQQEQDDWAKYWGIHVRAINYERFPEGVHNEHSTMSRSPAELLESNNGAFLNTTINLVQPHKHSNAYCLRKVNNEYVCRFSMPRDNTDAPFVVVPEGRSFFR